MKVLTVSTEEGWGGGGVGRRRGGEEEGGVGRRVEEGRRRGGEEGGGGVGRRGKGLTPSKGMTSWFITGLPNIDYWCLVSTLGIADIHSWSKYGA